MKLIALSLVSLWIAGVPQLSGLAYGSQCSSEQRNDFSETSEQLLYIQSPDTIASTSVAFDPIHADHLIINASLSPDGAWLAFVQMGSENESTVELHEIHGGSIYTIELEPDTGNPLYWLSDEQFLTVLTPSRTSPPAFYPHEIINPFTGERQRVLPYSLTFPNNTDPLFPGVDFGQHFLISPNGKYGMVFETDGAIVLYDIENREALRTLEDVSDSGGWAWSADSRYLASYGLLANEENATTGTIYIYDVSTGAIYTVFTGDAELIDWTHSETTKTGQ